MFFHVCLFPQVRIDYPAITRLLQCYSQLLDIQGIALYVCTGRGSPPSRRIQGLDLGPGYFLGGCIAWVNLQKDVEGLSIYLPTYLSIYLSIYHIYIYINMVSQGKWSNGGFSISMIVYRRVSMFLPHMFGSIELGADPV